MIEMWKSVRALSLLTGPRPRTFEGNSQTADGQAGSAPSGNVVVAPLSIAHSGAVAGPSRATNPPEAKPASMFYVAVCGAEEVPNFQSEKITDLLTCVSPEYPVWRPNWPSLKNHLIVRFHDIDVPMEDYVCPGEEDVERILHFAQRLLRRSEKGQTVRLLTHCAAGISRSAAAALLILALQYGHGNERRAVEHLYSIRPQSRPNAALVNLGDAMLRRDGRLRRAVAEKRRQMMDGIEPVS